MWKAPRANPSVWRTSTRTPSCPADGPRADGGGACPRGAGVPGAAAARARRGGEGCNLRRSVKCFGSLVFVIHANRNPPYPVPRRGSRTVEPSPGPRRVRHGGGTDSAAPARSSAIMEGGCLPIQKCRFATPRRERGVGDVAIAPAARGAPLTRASPALHTPRPIHALRHISPNAPPTQSRGNPPPPPHLP